MIKNPPIYGKLCDTGPVECGCDIDYPKVNGIIDAGHIEIRVQVWTSVPFGPAQERGHCMEVLCEAPITDGVYEDAYRRIVGTYEDYWKDWGAVCDPMWKTKLAVACGSAMGRFMKSDMSA